jgi:hypothetical protein
MFARKLCQIEFLKNDMIPIYWNCQNLSQEEATTAFKPLKTIFINHPSASSTEGHTL